MSGLKNTPTEAFVQVNHNAPVISARAPLGCPLPQRAESQVGLDLEGQPARLGVQERLNSQLRYVVSVEIIFVRYRRGGQTTRSKGWTNVVQGDSSAVSSLSRTSEIAWCSVRASEHYV